MNRLRRLWVVLALNLGLVGGLIGVGLSAHSLGVLAEGADYLADAAAIAVSLLAIWLAGRPATPRRPGGYPRVTALAAAVNAGWLFVLSVLIMASGVDRLIVGAREVHGLPVVVASGIAAATMVVGVVILGGDPDDLAGPDGDALNFRAVLLDTAADAAAAGGVAVTGAVILAAGGLYWLDPLVALIIALVVAYHAVRLLGQVTHVLREETSSRSTPTAPVGGNGPT